MAIGTPIIGNTGFVAVGETMTLSNKTDGGTWSSSDDTIATVSNVGIVTGVSGGSVTITYSYTADKIDYTSTTPITIVALAYTNGFDISRILPTLIGRKGWKQPTQSDFPFILNSVNTSCLSGRPYNQDHKAATAYQLWQVQENASIDSDGFNQYLTDLQVGVVMSSLNSVFRRPSIIEEPKILFEKQFRTQYRPIQNAHKFCGWQLKPSNGDYTSKIESISFTATAPCTVTIYIYNDLRLDPLWQQDIDVIKEYDQTIINIENLYLSRLDDQHKGGIFYYGYYQDQLAEQGVEAVDVYLTWWEEPNMFAYQAFEANMDETFGFVRNSYYSNWRTYGLGVEVSTWWNYTNTIIRNAHEFDNLIGLFMIQKAIEETMQTTRANAQQLLTQDQMAMLYDTLEGRAGRFKTSNTAVDFATGIRNRIELEVKRVQKTFFPDDEMIFTIPPTYETQYALPSLGHIM